MVNALTDKTAEVRQAAAYGVGVIAQCGGEVYADVCARMCYFSFSHASRGVVRPTKKRFCFPRPAENQIEKLFREF